MSVVGIDFGNVQSVIAVARNRGVDVITNEVSNRFTPSLVSFGTKQRYLGESAKTQEISNFKNTVGSLKRLAGRTLKDEELTKIESQYINAQLCDGDSGEVAASVQYAGEQQNFTGTQLTAMYFSALKDITQKATNGAVSDCVISVPGYFTDMQRRALINAAEIAGLNPLKLMNDTTAAALSYGITKTDLPEEKPRHICFVDVGHSTYQVCIAAFTKGKVAIVSTSFDRNFGGRDLDQLLVDHFAAQFKDKYKIDIKSNNRALFRLRTACEKTKKVLSANAQAPISVECIMNDVDVSGMITREEFEALAADYFSQKVTPPLERALQAAQMSREDIDAVEIIGGTSRVPAVKEKIKEFFNGKELSTTLNSDEAVAKGCAFQCAILSPVFRVREFDVKDATPFAIDMRWENGKETLSLIAANSQAPVTKALSLYKKQPFEVEAHYADPANDLPKGVDSCIGKVRVQLKESADNVALKVKAKIDTHGLLSVSSVSHLVETVEDVKEDGSAAEKEKGKEDAEKEEPKKKKTTTRKIEVPFTSDFPTAISKDKLEKLRETELEMISADTLVRDTEEKKNALEEYIYDARAKLDSAWAQFVVEGDKTYLQDLLTKAEDWLYSEEGEDATKSVYNEKLAELQKIGLPIAERYRESEARPDAVRKFKQSAEYYMRWTENKEDKYLHVDTSDCEKITTRCAEKLQWLENQVAKQSERAKHEIPVVKSSQIETERESLTFFCNGIINKPKPKVEEAKPNTEEEKAAESKEEKERSPSPNRAAGTDKEPPAFNSADSMNVD